MDVVDVETWQVGVRKMFEFTWVLDPDKPPYGTEDEAEEEHEEGEPEWYKVEHPGIWNFTDVIYTGSESTSSEKDGITVKAERYGADGQNIRFTFDVTGDVNVTADTEYSCKGEEKKLYLQYSAYKYSYYAEDMLYPRIGIFPELTQEHSPGTIDCIFALCDVEFDKSPSGPTVQPKNYFSAGYPKESVKKFSPDPRGKTMSWSDYYRKAYLSLEGCFPQGAGDGEKIYLVYSATDEVTGECSLYNICEYTYTTGPIVEWMYNQPGY